MPKLRKGNAIFTKKQQQTIHQTYCCKVSPPNPWITGTLELIQRRCTRLTDGYQVSEGYKVNYSLKEKSSLFWKQVGRNFGISRLLSWLPAGQLCRWLLWSTPQWPHLETRYETNGQDITPIYCNAFLAKLFCRAERLFSIYFALFYFILLFI